MGEMKIKFGNEAGGMKREDAQTTSGEVCNNFARKLEFPGEVHLTESEVGKWFGDKFADAVAILRERGFSVTHEAPPTEGKSLISAIFCIPQEECVVVIDAQMPERLDYDTPGQEELSLKGAPEDDENAVTARMVRARLYREFREGVQRSKDVACLLLNFKEMHMPGKVFIIDSAQMDAMKSFFDAPYLEDIMNNAAQDRGYAVFPGISMQKMMKAWKFVPPESQEE